MNGALLGHTHWYYYYFYICIYAKKKKSGKLERPSETLSVGAVSRSQFVRNCVLVRASVPARRARGQTAGREQQGEAGVDRGAERDPLNLLELSKAGRKRGRGREVEQNSTNTDMSTYSSSRSHDSRKSQTCWNSLRSHARARTRFVVPRSPGNRRGLGHTCRNTNSAIDITDARVRARGRTHACLAERKFQREQVGVAIGIYQEDFDPPHASVIAAEVHWTDRERFQSIMRARAKMW